VLGDSAYGTGATLAELRDARAHRDDQPWPLRPSIPGGFTTALFTVDEAARTITCPAGRTVTFTPVKRSAKFDPRRSAYVQEFVVPVNASRVTEPRSHRST
jgi:hypothetical protein